MLRAIRDTGDVFPAMLIDDQNIVLAIAARPRPPFRDHDHRLDGDHHARFEHRIDIFKQLQPGLAAIVVTQGAKRVAVAEGPVLQQVVLKEYLVELQRNVRATHARLDQL